MPRHIVDLSPTVEKLAWDSVKKGLYASFDHLVSVALENQLKADQGNAESWHAVPSQRGRTLARRRADIREQDAAHPDVALGSFGGEPALTLSTARQLMAEASQPVPEKPRMADEPADESLVGTILWGQFYRFLPIKPALRVLARSSTTELPILSAFKEKACLVAEAFGTILRESDRVRGKKLGEKLSTSFPESVPKSRRRYQDQYLAYVRPSDRRLDGMCARLKFINIVSQGDELRIGITPAGLEYASLPNPIVDGIEGATAPLTRNESLLLIGHIASKLPEELRHMHAMVALIGQGVGTRERLNEKMGEYYASYYDHEGTWTAALVNTMRAGVQSRLFELGLVERSKTGRGVSYTLSDFGEHFLNELPAEA